MLLLRCSMIPHAVGIDCIAAPCDLCPPWDGVRASLCSADASTTETRSAHRSHEGGIAKTENKMTHSTVPHRAGLLALLGLRVG